MVQQVPSGADEKQQAAEAVLRPGRIIQDKYLVHRIIGVGGMCAVGSATNVLLDQVIALKVLLPTLAKNSEMVLRFMREARSAARLKSEHVARVFDVGMLESGEPYMVMEFLEGCDLGVVLDGRGAVPVQEAVEYVVQACEGIGEAHAMGIVHRDLKPENLFLARRADGVSRIKVLDFGIAKAMVPTESGQRPSYLTEETTTFGTPTYMSPEQLREARDVDARSDIFSIGVVLYELVSGRVPFEGDTTADLHASILMEEPSPLHEIDPTVPEAFDAVVQRCLAKERHERFSNVAELAEALLPFAPPSMQDYGDRVSRVVMLSRGDFDSHPTDSGPPSARSDPGLSSSGRHRRYIQPSSDPAPRISRPGSERNSRDAVEPVIQVLRSSRPDQEDRPTLSPADLMSEQQQDKPKRRWGMIMSAALLIGAVLVVGFVIGRGRAATVEPSNASGATLVAPSADGTIPAAVPATVSAAPVTEASAPGATASAAPARSSASAEVVRVKKPATGATSTSGAGSKTSPPKPVEEYDPYGKRK